MLADVSDIGFKVRNFTTENMASLDAQWDDISDSLKVAAGLLSDFGLSGAILTADSVLIPIAYYVHHRKLTNDYRAAARYREDRTLLRSWVLRSLIVRGVWGSGLDTLLRDLRDTIKRQGSTGFLLAALEHATAMRGKSFAVTDALVEDILSLRYGGPRTFAVLATLFDHVDTQNQHHVDHIFPAARLDKKALSSATRRRGEADKWSNDMIADFLEKRDQLPNLELLPGPENIGKSDEASDLWVKTHYPTPDTLGPFIDRNALPVELPHGVDDFNRFFEGRRAKLAERIRLKLTTQADETTPELSAEVVPDIDEELAEADSGD